MYCGKCGTRAMPGDRFCGECGSPLSAVVSEVGLQETDAREQLLQAIERELAQYPQLAVSRSRETDLEIKSVLADASWGLGKKKVEYSACLLLKPTDRTAVFWEMIKEVGSGMGIFGGFKVETYKSDGKTISGSVKEKGFGPTGKVIDYTWDYAGTREMVEMVVKASGWSFTTVLRKGKAMYR